VTVATRPVVVLGDVNVDLTLQAPDRSVPRESRTLSEPTLSGGGTAGNTAAGLASLGVPVEFIGSIGDDGFGRWIASDFASLGVGCRGLVVHDVPTAQVIALLEPDGDRSLFVWPTDGGALTCLSPAELDPDLIASASWLHTSGMCLRAAPLRDAVLAGMALARAAGVSVSLDLNLRVELWGLNADKRAAVEAAVGLADVVLGSGEEELVQLSGTDSIETAARVIGGGRRTVIARLGAGGAVAFAGDGSAVRSPGFVVPTRNAVGAGDAFDAGFVAAMVEGRPLAEALRWGNAVAALKVARTGGARDLPSRAEAEALVAAPE
jgi:sugar/nucleoside kinase (ribokinase family)